MQWWSGGWIDVCWGSWLSHSSAAGCHSYCCCPHTSWLVAHPSSLFLILCLNLQSCIHDHSVANIGLVLKLLINTVYKMSYLQLSPYGHINKMLKLFSIVYCRVVLNLFSIVYFRVVLNLFSYVYFRVVQKNLVFVVGLSQRLADPEVLKKPEYFGKFGKIHKVVINHSTSYAGAQVSQSVSLPASHLGLIIHTLVDFLLSYFPLFLPCKW